jgi:feruloyl esterase
VSERLHHDVRTFDVERDAAAVAARLAPLMNATDPDLGAFYKRGGKLILFHGWNDPAISAYETIDYYQAVRGRMGNAVDAFARLYLIPGLQHCGGGPGATYSGGTTVPFRDAEYDFSAAVERWVEEGVAPGEMVATAAPDRANLAAPAPATPRRRICPYPQIPVFRGSGSPDDPTAWACQAP